MIPADKVRRSAHLQKPPDRASSDERCDLIAGMMIWGCDHLGLG